MKVKLEQVTNEAKVSKGGKPYTAASIKVGGVYYNGFGNKTTQTWVAGQEVDVEFFEEEYNGKMYKKFKALDVGDVKMLDLEGRVKKIEEFLFQNKGAGSFQSWLDNPTK